MSENNQSNSENRLSRYDLDILRQSICSRLDGHGLDIRDTKDEVKEVRKEQIVMMKEQAATNSMLIKHIADQQILLSAEIARARDTCSGRHNSTTIKTVGTSAFISGVMWVVGLIWKVKSGN